MPLLVTYAVALCFDVCNEGRVMPASDEIVTNPASANELCFSQIHGALCMTEDEFCLTVNGSSRVKRCIQAGAGGFTNLFADIGTAVLPVSDLSRSQVTLSMVTLLLISQ